jgi:uncharacterized membrane protein YdjX (TVP38/TMEM64 family)
VTIGHGVMHTVTSAPRGFAFRRFLPLLALAAGAAAFMVLGGDRYLSFSALAEHREFLVKWIARIGAAAPFCFIAVYAALTALSIPGATLLSVAAGLPFGTWCGTLYAVTGATFGATVVFAAARAGFGNVAERAGPWIKRLEAGFRANAFNYLLVLRLIPLFPFWLVNLAAALTGVGFATYVAGTFIGIIPGCFLFVSLGRAFGDVIGAGGSPDLNVMLRPGVLLPIGGLAVLALMPIAFKRYRSRQ